MVRAKDMKVWLVLEVAIGCVFFLGSLGFLKEVGCFLRFLVFM